MRFPDVQGENLDGDARNFPQDFAARTIVLVAFDLKQRTELESWVPFVDRYARAGTAHGVVIAAISRSMRMMKNLIVTTMRKAAPNAQSRVATVPLFIDLDAFCLTLGIIDRTAIQIFVVEVDGEIRGHRSGPFDAAAGVAIASLLGQAA